MNTKKNIGLLVLLIVQAALIVYLYQPSRNTAKPAAAIFNNLQADMIKSLTITDANAKSVHLAKIAGHWTVGENKYPADSGKIKGIMQILRKLKKSRLISRSRGSHSRLKVGEQMFKRKVSLTKSNGKKLTFFLGTSPSSKTIYLRRAGDNDVYEISGLTTWQLQTDNNSWWQAQYVTVNQAKLRGLSIKGKNAIALTRTAKGNWQLTDAPATSKLNSKRIGQLLDTLSGVFITGYEAKNFTPKGKAVATITYKTNEKSFNLQIWAAKDKKADTQIIKNSMSKFYARISSYILQDTLNLQPADLLTKPKH